MPLYRKGMAEGFGGWVQEGQAVSIVSYEYELHDFCEKLIGSIATLFSVLDASDTFAIRFIHK